MEESTFDKGLKNFQNSSEMLGEAKTLVDKSEKGLKEALQYLADVTPPENREAIINFVYWRHLDVPTRDIAEAFGVPLSDIEGTGLFDGGLIEPQYRADIACSQCGTPYKLMNRHVMKYQEDVFSGKLGKERAEMQVCEDCYFANAGDEQARMDAMDGEVADRLEDLREMPYASYLKTPEWERTRYEMLSMADGKCQECTTDHAPLDVYHKTVERLGDEWPSDLVVLCRSCRERRGSKLIP